MKALVSWRPMNNTTTQTVKIMEAARQARATGRVLVKLGIDAHLSGLVVVEQMDEEGAKPARKMSAEALVRSVKKHRESGHEVFTCYEAGPLGFGLHERLAMAGAHNVVVRPRTLDEYGQRLKTDRRDAAQLASNLDRWVAGNSHALAAVAVPSAEEQAERTRGRQRMYLSRQRRRELQQLRGTALYHGIVLRGQWWRPRRWLELRPLFPDWLQPIAEETLARVGLIDRQMAALEASLSAAAPAQRPKGLGALTSVLIEREIVDWQRFSNPRQVASYTGLVPRENSSGGRQCQGAITKHGNPRLRTLLIECAWRLLWYQPGYRPLKKWGPVLMDPQSSRARRKKLLIALARQWAVDLWRWRTGRVQLADLGLIPLAELAA